MILNPHVVVWVCGSCNTRAAKPFAVNQQEYHNCPGKGMLTIPMVREGEKAKVTFNEREDYINGDGVQVDGNNRPIMNVTVEREDGIDCSVFAPVVTTGTSINGK